MDYHGCDFFPERCAGGGGALAVVLPLSPSPPRCIPTLSRVGAPTGSSSSSSSTHTSGALPPSCLPDRCRWFDLVVVLQSDNTVLWERLEKRCVRVCVCGAGAGWLHCRDVAGRLLLLLPSAASAAALS